MYIVVILIMHTLLDTEPVSLVSCMPLLLRVGLGLFEFFACVHHEVLSMFLSVWLYLLNFQLLLHVLEQYLLNIALGPLDFIVYKIFDTARTTSKSRIMALMLPLALLNSNQSLIFL